MCNLFVLISKENYNYNIHHVFIIKPDNFWQKQKTSFASSKYSFEVETRLDSQPFVNIRISIIICLFYPTLFKHSLISIEQLSKYFEANQLTADLDGSLPYNNDQWIDFRIVSCAFVFLSIYFIIKIVKFKIKFEI
jgi:triple functional domain protein